MTDKTESRKAARGFWKKLLLGSLFILGLLVLLVWICLFRDVPIEISKETTYITEPLKSDGKQVDYFRAIELETYPPNMKTDENGFRIIVRALGVSSESASDAWNIPQIYKKLGLDPAVPPTMTFQEPDEFVDEYMEPQQKKWEQELEPRPFTIPETDESLSEEMKSGQNVLTAPEEDPYQKSGKLKENLERPWTLDEMPMMADWLKVNSPALDLVAKA
ncbi:MAG: hypothetical protein PVH19_03320, partial [Planctomycetia bacterium]